MSFAKNLEKLMTSHNMSQYRLWKLSGVSQPTILRALNGSNPKSETIKKLAGALKASSSDLIDGVSEQAEDISRHTSKMKAEGGTTKRELIPWPELLEKHSNNTLPDMFCVDINIIDGGYLETISQFTVSPKKPEEETIYLIGLHKKEVRPDLYEWIDTGANQYLKRVYPQSHSSVYPLSEIEVIAYVVLAVHRPLPPRR
ncbi:MAG: hypothetical protein COB23_03065 [Methylophaga sp.]|nr:MAG: hypothetical protein COB23_03065 [Methylophaga sp.]